MRTILRATPLLVASCALALVPLSASAQTVASSNPNIAAIEAEAQALLQEINQLEGHLAPGSTTGATVSSGSCPTITRSLKIGSTGTDVAQLQEFLAQDRSIYPSGLVTGYFGPLTQAAVQAWQTRHNIVSSGTPATTGFGVVGPRTSAAIALACSTVSTGTNTSQLPEIGGAIQVTPTSGPALLPVTVQAIVNILNSCTAATYILNFGDGTQSIAIPVAAGTCVSQSQFFSHTYASAGTYTIVLASGGHQATAEVTVSASSSAPPIPADSIQASVTSGTPPLNVVFTGTVSALTSFGCSGSCADTINFGDGNVGLVQLPTTANSWQSYMITHSYNTVGSYTAQLESPTGTSSAAPITITVTSSLSTSTPTGVQTTSPTSTSQTTQPVGGSYGVVSITPNVGGNPLAVNVLVTLPSCALYQVNWGDNSAVSTQTAQCASGGSTMTLSHIYAAGGTYTIALNDGNGKEQAGAQVSISN
ncbi:MAG TPA: PKD domain-containing protein [Candidatus Paceibacterota bacterium]|nr:PKD domain-containing protein [Candidatus Paceibacterota bacterium]